MKWLRPMRIKIKNIWRLKGLHMERGKIEAKLNVIGDNVF
jgi:hypothetical protein